MGGWTTRDERRRRKGKRVGWAGKDETDDYAFGEVLEGGELYIGIGSIAWHYTKRFQVLYIILIACSGTASIAWTGEYHFDLCKPASGACGLQMAVAFPYVVLSRPRLTSAKSCSASRIFLAVRDLWSAMASAIDSCCRAAYTNTWGNRPRLTS